MTRSLPISLLVATAIMAIAAPAANAAIYMKYDGIKGSVTADSPRSQSPIQVP